MARTLRLIPNLLVAATLAAACSGPPSARSVAPGLVAPGPAGHQRAPRSLGGPALAPTGFGSYTDKQSSFAYVYYVPSTPKAAYPVVLALHGCLESPANFEAGTRFFEDGEANGYVVVMPQHLVGAGADVNPKG